MAKTRSRPRIGKGYHGHLPQELWDVLKVAWEEGIYASSNYARTESPLIALAASMGWISSISLDGLHYGRQWNITHEGVCAYERIKSNAEAPRP